MTTSCTNIKVCRTYTLNTATNKSQAILAFIIQTTTTRTQINKLSSLKEKKIHFILIQYLIIKIRNLPQVLPVQYVNPPHTQEPALQTKPNTELHELGFDAQEIPLLTVKTYTKFNINQTKLYYIVPIYHKYFLTNNSSLENINIIQNCMLDPD